LTADFANPDPIALGYVPPKTALTSPTIQYARGLASENILTNAVCPGFVATDLNGFRGVPSTSEGAVQAVLMATIPAEGRPAPRRPARRRTHTSRGGRSLSRSSGRPTLVVP